MKSVPCSMKFVSFEPLLGEIDSPNLTGIDWIIVGAETGEKASIKAVPPLKAGGHSFNRKSIVS